jgi:hypothetical protein
LHIVILNFELKQFVLLVKLFWGVIFLLTADLGEIQVIAIVVAHDCNTLSFFELAFKIEVILVSFAELFASFNMVFCLFTRFLETFI